MKNAKALGKFKDEMKGIPVEEFVALCPKMYSIQLKRAIVVKHHNLKKAATGKTKAQSEISKRKGLPKKLPKEQEHLFFVHKKYRDIYNGEKVKFPTLNHTKMLLLYTGTQTKAELAALDDKSYWFDHERCVRYGHSCIQKFEEAQAKLGQPVPAIFTPTNELTLLEPTSSLLETEYPLSDTEEDAFHKMAVTLEENNPMILRRMWGLLWRYKKWKAAARNGILSLKVAAFSHWGLFAHGRYVPGARQRMQTLSVQTKSPKSGKYVKHPD